MIIMCAVMCCVGHVLIFAVLAFLVHTCGRGVGITLNSHGAGVR